MLPRKLYKLYTEPTTLNLQKKFNQIILFMPIADILQNIPSGEETRSVIKGRESSDYENSFLLLFQYFLLLSDTAWTPEPSLVAVIKLDVTM
jgi:hypothetical protein